MRVQRKRDLPNRAGIEKLDEGLKKLSDEFQTDDAESVQVSLDTHISTALEEIPAKKLPGNLTLHETIDHLFAERATSDLLKSAELFEDLINTYRGSPSEEEMEEAREVLDEIVEMLDTYLGRSGRK